MTKHETMCETYKHKQLVSRFVNMLVSELISRGVEHDNSKLEEFEADTLLNTLLN